MGELSPRQICVIDGDEAIRDSMATFGTTLGNTILCFASAAEFFAALDGIDPVCVVCAAELPDGDGIQVFDRLHADGAKKVPFALMLDKADDKLLAKAREHGISQVLRKPLLNQRLLAFFQQSAA